MKSGVYSIFLSLCRWALVCVILQGCVGGNGHSSCRTINAGIRLPNDQGFYFFSDNRYIDYDVINGVERTSGPVSRLGLGDLNRIDAVFSMPGVQNQVVLTSGPRYYRYNISSGHFRYQDGHGSLHEDFGIPPEVDAAFGLGHRATVIKGCYLWTFNAGTSGRFQRENRTLEDWDIPCDLDAAITWAEDGPVTFIKGHLMWRLYLEDSDDSSFVEGPFHTDDLLICSWFVCGEVNLTGPSVSGNSSMECNGDARLCPLRLDQVTLAGLHNAGSGFNHGFGMLNCWVKNHGLSIYDQLVQGIRHLDIDPCYDRCGHLGTCHAYFCGGSICAVIKQTRRFLLTHPSEVVTVNFNHEIVEPRKVFRELTRQLKAQLRPLLNSAFRESGNRQWPTLQEAIQSNKRLFVIYAYIIENQPYASYYRRNKWIHTEHWFGSTWREIEATSDCSGLGPATRQMCYHRQHRELVSVSTMLTPDFTTCVSDVADYCRPRLMETIKICESFRYRHGKSPNVLMVDYPEESPKEVTSVHHVVYLQNVRNILQHRSTQCQISIDAAVMVNHKALLFSGSKVVTYDLDIEMQVDVRSLPEGMASVDAAYMMPGHNRLAVIKDCFAWQVDSSAITDLTLPQNQPLESCRQYNLTTVDAAVHWDDALYLFHACHVIRVDSRTGDQLMDLNDWDLPCDVDAVMTSQDGASLYVFKDHFYWIYIGHGPTRFGGRTRAWNVDVVKCHGEN